MLQMTKIPPFARKKIEGLHGEDLHVYLQELKGKYEHSRNRIAVRAERMKLDWVKNQAEYFDLVVEEIDAIIADIF